MEKKDCTALVVASMFRNELSKEVIERQKSVKLGTQDRSKIEALMNKRLNSLNEFLTNKVTPRIGIFLDHLKDTQSSFLVVLRREKSENSLKKDKLEAEKAEKLEALKAEIDREYASKLQSLERDREAINEKIEESKNINERNVAKAKEKFDSKLFEFKTLIQKVSQACSESLWTQAVSLRDGQELLDKIPDENSFMTLMEKLAIESGDNVLKTLLAGKVEEKQDIYCDSCGSYNRVIELINDAQELDFITDSGDEKHRGSVFQKSDNNGKKIMRCMNCGREAFQSDMGSIRSPFRQKLHEVIIFDDAKSVYEEVIR